MPAFGVTPTAPQQQLSPRKASVATSATNSVAASNALKPVVVSLPASDSNKLAAAGRGGGGGCKGSGVRAKKKSSASSVSSQSSSSGVIAPPPQSGGQQQQSAKLSVPSFLPQPQSQHSPIPGLPQAVSRDPFHFPPPQPCAPNPTAGRGEIHLAAGDGNVDRSGALRDPFPSVAAGILAGIFTAPHSPRPSLLPSPHSSASRSPPSSTPLLVFVGPFKLATRTAAAAASKCFSVGFHVLYWRGVFFH